MKNRCHLALAPILAYKQLLVQVKQKIKKID